MENYSFRSSDRTSAVQYYVWRPQTRPVAIVQIIHGMSEHAGRYDAFASWLAGQGILVAADDHIGHGRTARPEDYGYFGPSDGWKHLVDDEELLREEMRRQFPDTPYVMLGHSMGSFMLRAWLSMYAAAADVDGVIIMGTCGSSKAVAAGAMLASLIAGFKGEKRRSRLINGMVFGPYSKPFASEGVPNAWLSRDRRVCEEYEADPMAGFSFTLGGYTDLFALVRYVTAGSWYGSVPKDMTVLIASGGDDPVGAFGAGPAETFEKLDAAGCSDVSMLLYEEMRHEILNEIGKEEVWKDMRDFVLDMAQERAGSGEEAAASPQEEV